MKSWLIGKDSDAGRDWGQEEKGTTEDEMAGWHHRLDAHEFGWTLGVGDWQGGLTCCNSWGRKESDTIEQLNWTELRVLNQCKAPHLFTHCYETNWKPVIPPLCVSFQQRIIRWAQSATKNDEMQSISLIKTKITNKIHS